MSSKALQNVKRLRAEFVDVAALISDVSLTYGSVSAGEIIQTRAEGFSYEVAPSGASDHRVTTAGGLKLYVLSGQDGTYSNQAAGGTGTIRTQINTSQIYPNVFRALSEIRNNGELTNSLLVHSYWTGATGANYQNNDTTLFETHNTVLSDSTNYSWSVSAPNAYHRIPAGVTDNGFRVGVLGWATSVPKVGYLHEGTLNTQLGVWGRAGFQGPGTPSTGRVEGATGVRGEIVMESACHIENASALEASVVKFEPLGNIRFAYGVFANVTGGTDKNYSFYGANGDIYNPGGTIFAGTEYQDIDAPVALRVAGNSIEFGFPGPGGYGSAIGATPSAGYPFIAFCADADPLPATNTYTTQGEAGWVMFHDLLGSLIWGRLPTASASNQAPVEAFRLDQNGRALFQLGPNSLGGYRVNNVTVVGAQEAAVTNAAFAAGATPTQAEFDALVTQVNTLLSRLRNHGLIAP